MSIEENIAARREVEEMVDLIGEQNDTFWKVFAHMACEKAGMDATPKSTTNHSPAGAMSDMEAQRFEKEFVPFGKYQFHTVADVPPDYWLAITESSFNIRLKRYLRSSRFQRWLEEPSED